MKKVFVINGPARTGKDTFINICRQLLANRMGVFTFSAVDEVKEYLKVEEGWDGVTKDAYWRLRMYEVKMRMVAENDRPTRYLVEGIETSPDNSVVFLHIREPEEIVKLLQHYPEAMTIHLSSEGVDLYENPADSNTQLIDYNFYLFNEGTIDEFVEIVRVFIRQELLEGEELTEEIDFGELK